jgi:hypothetical protein
VNNKIAYNYRSVISQEQQIYQHLLDLVQLEPANKMISRCKALFIEGIDYPEPEILSILDYITADKSAEQEFKNFLNRCCHILINRWHMQAQTYGAIPELVAIFQCQPEVSRKISYSLRAKAIRRLHSLVKDFIQSEQYQMLRRLAQVMAQSPEAINYNSQKPLITYIRRYPYLYEHCLLSEDSNQEDKQAVRVIQQQVQRKFEIDLSRYVTYQVRQAQTVKNSSKEAAQRVLQSVNNPTLLSNKILHHSLMHFIGKVEGNYTYRDFSQHFINYSRQSVNFKVFKNDLYEYLISSIPQEYGKRKFNERLYQQIQLILPEADYQKLDDFLMVRSCSQLLNFLVVESHSSPQHFIFVDLISNQGTTLTTGLLLKIVLICRKIKPYLEKKLAILFNHYESATTTGVQWLVQSLEQLNIALSIHFSDIDLSFFKQIMYVDNKFKI